jgi:glutaredoxin
MYRYVSLCIAMYRYVSLRFAMYKSKELLFLNIYIMVHDVYILGANYCSYFQEAKRLLNNNNNIYRIKSIYAQDSVQQYKSKLKVLKHHLNSLNITDNMREKMTSMTSSPIILIPEENFVGGYDDFTKHMKE